MILLCCTMFALTACGNNVKKTGSDIGDIDKHTVSVPRFDADSAYSFIQAQVDFGPRVPNSPAHVACGDFLAGKLSSFGATVVSQYANLPAYDGTMLKARNIIGSFDPDNKRRIVLFAHWDSRPWGDKDSDPAQHYRPIPGANDGASGVGVLLEVARHLQKQAPALGIDIIFLDAEDYGPHSSYNGVHKEEYWALGAQYWARNPHVQGYKARFGILLDMVGGKNAVFRYEGTSEEAASHINRKVWKTAAKLGFSRYFEAKQGGFVTDDHTFVNRYAKVPTIDIVAYSPDNDFFEHWHTQQDDMNAIDPATLQAVGETLMHVIYHEK